MNHNIKPYITSLNEAVPRCLLEEKIGAVLMRSNSNHEGIFVFDKKGNFHGLISPDEILFHKRKLYLSKANNFIFNPPQVTSKTPLYELAEFMLSSNLYTLPVFSDRRKLKGVIKADTVLEKIADYPNLVARISKIIKTNPPITTTIHSRLNEVYELMRTKKISRVIVVDSEGDFVSIISRRDIQDGFTAKPQKERFGRREEHLKNRSFFDEEKLRRRDAPITMFLKKNVLTAKFNTPIRSILTKMIKSNIHSVVLTKGLKPIGFLSRQDFLKAIAQLKPQTEIPILLHDEKKAINSVTILTTYEYLVRFAKKFDNQNPLKGLDLYVDTIRNAAGKKKLYELKLHALLKDGRIYIGRVDTRDIISGLRDSVDKIEHNVEKSDRQKHENDRKYY